MRTDEWTIEDEENLGEWTLDYEDIGRHQWQYDDKGSNINGNPIKASRTKEEGTTR